MSENQKKEQKSLVQPSTREIAIRSSNLVRRGLNHLSKNDSRTVHFPPQWSMGTLYIVPLDGEPWWENNWEKLGAAKGEIVVPPNKKLVLQVEEREVTECTYGTSYLIDLFTIEGFDEDKAVDYPNGEKYLRRERFTDLSPLACLKPDDLLGLDLSKVWVSNSPEETNWSSPFYIEKLTGLEWLRLSETPVDNLLFLENLTQLRGLEIWGTNICRLTPIDKLTNLRYLSLEVPEFFDLEYLETLVNLEILHIHINEDLVESSGSYPYFDVNLESLKGLTKLRLLDLRGLDIGGSVEAIREELGLPDCEIWI